MSEEFDPDAEEREFLNDGADEEEESEECVDCSMPLEDCECNETFTSTETDD